MPTRKHGRRIVAALGLLLALALQAPGAHASQQALPDSAALVTRLGNDTLAVERWVWDGDRITAEAVVRSPRTTLRRYVLELAPDGAMRHYEARVVPPDDPSGDALEVEVLERSGDAWTRSVTDEDGTRTETVAAGAGVLPFVDLVFWPYEVALRRPVQVVAVDTAYTQALLAGGRVLPFTVEWTGPDRVTVAHPFRGPSVVRVDDDGRLVELDASETTRKVVVTRVPWVDVGAAARRWAAADRAGRGVGELSGRAQAEGNVGGVTLTADYGTPSKRGREIFGNVVPWNERWRTGANRATHFSTDRTLVLGDSAGETLEVPPGTYTLFSVPAPEGGTLIVSRQTGQNGNSYDAAHDLGRVPMRRSERAEPVEVFTIAFEPTAEDRGELQLIWDRTTFAVPFAVPDVGR